MKEFKRPILEMSFKAPLTRKVKCTERGDFSTRFDPTLCQLQRQFLLRERKLQYEEIGPPFPSVCLSSVRTFIRNYWADCCQILFVY